MTSRAGEGSAGPSAGVGAPISIEIEDGDGGFYLFRSDGSGSCISDTWHQSLDEPKAQARFAFSVDEESWDPAD